MRNVTKKVPDSIQFTEFSIEGEPTFKSLTFDGQKIVYLEEGANGEVKKDYGEYLNLDVRGYKRNDIVYCDVYVYTQLTEAVVFTYYN